MNSPRHTLNCWREIARRIRQASRLFLFTDFDGTLVPIRKSPKRVVLPRRLRRRLERLAQSGVIVGIISGRRLEDVRRRAGVRHIWYVGVHGYFLRDRGNRFIALLSPRHRERIKRVRAALAQSLRGLPGIWIEPKEASVAVHFRGAPKSSVVRAWSAIAALQKKFPAAVLLRGKKVWEWLPDSRTDKGRALALILRRERSHPPRGRQLVFYLGDDATDELVFRKMKGISIAVGKKHNTAARYYLGSPAEVRRFLVLLEQAWQ